MPDPTPGSGQDDEQAADSASDAPGSAGATGSTETGPSPSAAGLDWQALLEALAAGGLLGGDLDGQDAAAAEERRRWAGG